MNKTPELLPCPFCGGEAKLVKSKAKVNDYRIKCNRCYIKTGWWMGEIDELIEQWNTRVYPKEVQEAIEKQKPKKPKKDIVHYRCPNCDAMLNTYDTCNCCNHCGQKLDWSE